MSAVVHRGRGRIACCVVVVLASLSTVSAAQLLDRVVARVNGSALTLTDVQAAIGLGVVESSPGEDSEKSARAQLIERELLLIEVARFPPAEPATAAIDMETAALKAKAGSQLPALMQSTGLDDERIREIARDTLRIQAYLNQRFGTAAVVTDEEALQYYRAHTNEFARNGRTLPFDDVQQEARQRASAERRRATIAQWLRDLRARSDVVEITPHTP